MRTMLFRGAAHYGLHHQALRLQIVPTRMRASVSF